MPVFSHGYTLNSDGTQFKHQKKATGEVDKQGSKPAQHAEQVAWKNLAGKGPYLMMQNAFPCYACHDYFIGLSNTGHNIIIRVMDDQGQYSFDHRPRPASPCTIYYQAGAATYNGVPPVWVPPIPALPTDYTVG